MGEDQLISDTVIELLNNLRFPNFQWSAQDHERTLVREPAAAAGLPVMFTLCRDLIPTVVQPSLENYLSRGISTASLSDSGVIGSKMTYAQRASLPVVMESEIGLTGVLVSSVFAAVNETLWEPTQRNALVYNRHFGMVGTGLSGKPDLELRRHGGNPSRLMVIEIKPHSTVTLETVEMMVRMVRESALRFKNNRFERDLSRDDLNNTAGRRAVSVLNQIYCQFAESPHVSFDVLLTDEAAVLFQRTQSSFRVSDIVMRNGIVSRDALCSNFFTLFLGLATLPDDAHLFPVTPLPRQTRQGSLDIARANVATPHRATLSAPMQPQQQGMSQQPVNENYRLVNVQSHQTPSPPSSTPPLASSNDSSPQSVDRNSPLILSNSSTMVVDSCNAYSSSTDCFRGALFPNHLDGIVFSSVDPHDIHWSVPPVAQASPAPNSPLIIPIQDRVGQGGVWNAFSSGGDVLKVIRIERDNDDDYAASYHAGLRNHVGAEISCLTTLAGTDFVPRLKGVWASATAEEEYWAVLTSYAGEAVAPNDNAARWLPSWIKQQILDAYAQLHAHGILHGDPKTAHWRLSGPNASLCLIDFSHGETVSGLSVEEQEGMLRMEIGDVRGLLDELKGDWVAHPYTLHDEERKN